MTQQLVTIERATPECLREVLEIISQVDLPHDGVEEHLSGFLVARGEGGGIVGCVGLERHGELGLLRSAAALPQRIRRHIWSFSDHLGLFAAASGCHALRGRSVHHRRLLVHFLHIVCKPGRNARTGRKRYVRRDSSRGCARLYRRADRRGRGRDCALSMARPCAS
jgi:hypothetical protein